MATRAGERRGSTRVMMSRRVLVVAALLMLHSFAAAQMTCDGLLTHPETITSDVIVDGVACVLRGVTVTGSVSVTNGGVLLTDGDTHVMGSVSAEGSGNIRLMGRTFVKGDMGMANPEPGASLIIGPHSNIGKIGLEGPGSLLLRGTTGSLGTKWGGNVVVAGGHIGAGGLLLEGGNGTLVLCGAHVGGGVKIGEAHGDLLAVKRPGCPASNISGIVSIEKGSGAIRIIGNKLAHGDLVISEQEGDVEVRDAVVGDMGLGDIAGKVTLVRLHSDSDGTIGGTLQGVHIEECEIHGDFLIGHNTGDIVLKNSLIAGDMSIGETFGNVYVTGNRANNEQLSITGTKGVVKFRKNHELSISIIENINVYFEDNWDLRVAEVSKNTGYIVVKDNSVGTFTCIDNTEVRLFSNNRITGLANGQCAV